MGQDFNPDFASRAILGGGGSGNPLTPTINAPDRYDASIGTRLALLNKNPNIQQTSTTKLTPGFPNNTNQRTLGLRDKSGAIGSQWDSSTLDAMYPSLRNVPFFRDIRPTVSYAQRVLDQQRKLGGF